MKTIQTIYMKGVLLGAAILFLALPVKAQMTDNGYANVDWQYNFPLSNHFTDKSSGWGMNLEGGYFLTDHCSLGLFLAYHSNHEYVGRQTLPMPEGASLTTDQQHTTFQLPFGLSARYTCCRGSSVHPYAGVKIGTQYAQMKSDFNVFEDKTNTWGFYLSPEVGFSFYPWAYGPGVHFALYYSYATNQGDVLTYSQHGMNNLGFRIGLAF